MARRYRQPSPPSRYIVAERASTGGVYGSSADPYSKTYRSPRTSGDRVDRVVPISTERYINGIKVSSEDTPYTTYQARPRRATLTEEDALRPRAPPSSSSASSSHRLQVPGSRPAAGRTVSPEPRSRYDERSYDAVPQRTHSRRESTKLYAVDGSSTRLLEDPMRDRRREDLDRAARRASDAKYRAHGEASNDDYEYTEPRRMYEETEPKWRVRSDSFDTVDRERGGYNTVPRSSVRGGAPPSAARGLEKYRDPRRRDSLRDDTQDGPVRRETLRDTAYSDYGRRIGERSRAESPPRYKAARQNSYNEDDYRVLPRTIRTQPYADDRDAYMSRRDDYDDRHEAERYRQRPADPEVRTRGFGLRRNVDEETEASNESRHVRKPSLRANSPPRSSPRREHTPDEERDYVRRAGYGRDTDRLRAPDADRRRSGDFDRFRNSKDALGDRDREFGERRVRTKDDAGYREYNRDIDDKYRERRPEWDHATAQGKPSDGSKSPDSKDAILPVAGLAAAGTATYAVREASNRRKHEEDREGDERERSREVARDRGPSPVDNETPRRRRYVDKDEPDDDLERNARARPPMPMDPDEEYRQRIKLEAEKSRGLQAESSTNDEGSGRDRRRRDNERDQEQSPALAEAADENARSRRPREHARNESLHEEASSSRALAPYRAPDEDPQTPAAAPTDAMRDDRLAVVEPARDKEPPRGILRKPTEKFPEHPETVREGVAPLKDTQKKGIPPTARWTKINRDLVNPQALEEAKERFEERQDCVIVLRVLTLEEIQQFADRTKEIRESRYDGDRKSRKSRNDRPREHDV